MQLLNYKISRESVLVRDHTLVLGAVILVATEGLWTCVIPNILRIRQYHIAIYLPKYHYGHGTYNATNWFLLCWSSWGAV